MKHHHCDCSMDEHEHHEHHEHHGCGCHHHHHEEGSLKSKLYLIGVTIILLIVAVFIEKHYDLATWQLLLVYLIPYLLIGHETLGEAAEGIAKGDMFNEHFLMAIATIGALCIGFFPGSETEFPEAVFVMLFFQVRVRHLRLSPWWRVLIGTSRRVRRSSPVSPESIRLSWYSPHWLWRLFLLCWERWASPPA